jgi:acyl-coenzyme A thioesterase PaaI-like protein
LRLFSPRRLLRIISFYPPFLGAGIRVSHIGEGYRTFIVKMKLSFYNRNYVGTHFGGSLYSMCDPFYMLILIENLGRDYRVWDKSASIRFRKPGRGTVTARFHLSEEEIAAIRRTVDTEGLAEPRLTVDVVDAQGEVVARVEKHLHVRRKK